MVVVFMVTLSAVVGCAIFRITGLRGVWGIGYESLQQAFDSNIHTGNFFIFGSGKLFATALSIAVSAPGVML